MGIVTIERKILQKNDEIAGENRMKLAEHRIFAVNLVSAPGAGKTSLIENLVQKISREVRVAVIEGDVQTNLDAERVARFGVPAVQIITRGGCHLEAALVRDALEQVEMNRTDLLIIENVGNLVCPAAYDLGEAVKIVLVSVTEGEDKPLKYPAMFRTASVLILNKIDLLPYVPCSLDALRGNALKINPTLSVFPVSCTTGEGIPSVCDWLGTQVSVCRNTLQRA